MFIKNNILKPYLNKSNYNTLSEKQIKSFDRDSRHFAPANKEWKNSVYSYNKGSLFNIAAKDKKVSDTIKMYFNLVLKPVNITKSKRMRDWLRRSSTRQFFVSKPEIKQNNDKAIITVYTHDREKVLYLRKLFILNKWLNSNILGLEAIRKERPMSDRYLIGKYTINSLLKARIFNKYRRLTYRISRSAVKRSFSKYSLKPTFFKLTAKSLLRKKQFIKNIIFYHFLKWALLLFMIYVQVMLDHVTIVRRDKYNTIEDVVNLTLTKIKKGKKKNQNTVIAKKTITIKGSFNINTLKSLNIILLQYLMLNINKGLSVKQGNKIYGLFNYFKKKYFQAIARKHLKKEILIIKYLTKLYINKFKFYSYLPGLKSLLSNIYSKKIQLNIVNLKYLHLSSDLFSEAISIKLRKRTTGLLRVLRKSFKLVKTFKPNNMFLLAEKNKNYNIKDVNTFFGKYDVINGNVLNFVFKKMFGNTSNKYKNTVKGLNTNLKDLLISLKYKWITGIRVEAKGRLTKRYAAARALFKYKFRGTLKNLDHLRNIENKLQSPGVSILRGEARPNTQYSFMPSKRRIGAFGIKSWISNS